MIRMMLMRFRMTAVKAMIVSLMRMVKKMMMTRVMRRRRRRMTRVVTMDLNKDNALISFVLGAPS